VVCTPSGTDTDHCVIRFSTGDVVIIPFSLPHEPARAGRLHRLGEDLGGFFRGPAVGLEVVLAAQPVVRAQFLAIYAAKMALMTGASSGDGGGDPLLASAAMADWRSMSSAIMEL
jgi:hypothetical protein